MDPSLGSLSRDGVEKHLAPKFMAVLVELAAAGGQIVRRDDLLDSVWPETVVGEAVLTRAISELRSALGDTAGKSEAIHTVPKIGYRLMLDVKRPGQMAAPPVSAQSRTATGRMPALALLVAAAGVVIAIALWPDQQEATVRFRQVPLTSFPGEEFDPEFSADGSLIAFSRVTGLENQSDIYTKDILGTEFVRITDTPLFESSPTWSPDSRFLAFVRCDAETGEAAIVSRSLSGFGDQVLMDFGPLDCDLAPSIAWSPDGADIALDGDPRANRFGISLLDLSTRQVRVLTRPDVGYVDTTPRFSPDGSQVAYVRRRPGSPDAEILNINRDGSGEVVVIPVPRVQGMDWTGDGGMVYAARGEIWRININSMDRSWVAAPGVDIVQPRVSREDGQLVFVQSLYDVNIWGLAEGVETPIAASNRLDKDPAISPDGTRVAFISDRDGPCSVFASTIDGDAVISLASFEVDCWEVGAPRWSPDGLSVVFDVVLDGAKEVFVSSTTGSQPLRISGGPGNRSAPGWSSDSRYVYFATSGSELWKADVLRGSAERLNLGPGSQASESLDGEWLYVETDGVLKKYQKQGENFAAAQEVVAGIDPGNWWPTQAGVTLRRGQSIEFYDAAAGTMRVMWEIPEDSRIGIAAVAPDGRVVFDRVDRDEDDLILLAGFR